MTTAQADFSCIAHRCGKVRRIRFSPRCSQRSDYHRFDAMQDNLCQADRPICATARYRYRKPGIFGVKPLWPLSPLQHLIRTKRSLRRNARRCWRGAITAEFVDLKNFKIQHELFKSVPVDMMFRYNFVPLEQTEGRLAIAVSDPSKLMVHRRDFRPAGDADCDAGRDAVADHRPAEEDGAVAARAG